jgi:NADH-quinone oxidoreductase subunit G
LSTAAALAHRTGARLAWVPRRAGERGAIDAGALPTLLPGGRPVTDAVARAEVEQVWGGDLPPAPGRDLDAVLHALAEETLAAVVIGGIDPADVADPRLATDALERAGFVVSLEIRHSAVTEHADVVLPVSAAAEKAGRYVTWEGRRRPFGLTIDNRGAMPDGRVLHALAEELDVDLALPSVEAARAELLRLAPTAAMAPDAPTVRPGALPALASGEVLLATWHELLDAGRLQDGDEYLAGTAKTAVARIGAGTAAEIGASDGSPIAVGNDRGTVVLPAAITPMPDRVVWLPTNARDCSVRATLGAVHGSVVRISSDVPPVVGLGGGHL